MNPAPWWTDVTHLRMLDRDLVAAFMSRPALYVFPFKLWVDEPGSVVQVTDRNLAWGLQGGMEVISPSWARYYRTTTALGPPVEVDSEAPAAEEEECCVIL